MNARHGQTPIPMPDLVTHPSHIGRLSHQIRKSIAALRDRKIIVNAPSVGASGYNHPFQLIAGKDDDGDPVLYVRYGAFTVEKWGTAASGTTLQCSALEFFATINSGPLVSQANPIGSISPPGRFSLDVSTDYGAWIVAETALNSRTAFTDGSVPKVMAIYDPIVIISETATAASDSNTLTSTGTYEGYAAWFLGSVSVDGDGAVSLDQYRRSDITVVEPVWIHPVIVSADSGNDITAGSDGGAFYEEP
jgi:hypothetical protein